MAQYFIPTLNPSNNTELSPTGTQKQQHIDIYQPQNQFILYDTLTEANYYKEWYFNRNIVITSVQVWEDQPLAAIRNVYLRFVNIASTQVTNIFGCTPYNLQVGYVNNDSNYHSMTFNPPLFIKTSNNENKLQIMQIGSPGHVAFFTFVIIGYEVDY